MMFMDFALTLLSGLAIQNSSECQEYVAQLPPEVEKGYITVPEDWGHPDPKRQLQIFYYAENLSALISNAKDVSPVLYLNGGPGQPSHHIYEYFKSYVPLSTGIPFIYMDQRGTGCSGEFPIVEQDLEGAKRLALYGTRNIVRDAEALREHLLGKGSRWRVFGQSFGGDIVHRYLTLYPESITHAYAHGSSLMTDGIRWVMDRMQSQKRVGDLYLQKYPDDHETMKKARSQMPPDYCVGNGTLIACGEGLLEQIGWQYLTMPGAWKRMHQTISGLLDSQGNLDLNYVQSIIPQQITTEPSMTDFLVAVVPARELPGGLLNTWSCVYAVSEYLSHGDDSMNWMFNECRLALAAHAKYDSFIESITRQDYIEVKDLFIKLKTSVNTRFYLYGGDYDTLAPIEGYEEEVNLLKSLPNFEFSRFPNSGHNWIGESKIWNDLKSPVPVGQ